MYTTALLTFMAIGGFPSFVEDVKVDSSLTQKWKGSGFLAQENFIQNYRQVTQSGLRINMTKLVGRYFYSKL